MKFKKVLLVTLFLLPTLIQAQSEQLQREIRIAEGILQELFQDNLRSESPFFTFNNNRVSSDYIPGYGVHFILGNSMWNNNRNAAQINEIRIARSEENRSASVTVRNDKENIDSETEEVNPEELEERMMEYFTQYASLLRNLPENEHIRLSIGLPSPGTNIFIIRGQANQNIEFPKITKWVNKRDVLQLERGEISESRFMQQIQTADLSEVSETRDFNIFKSILDTSLQEADFEQLRIRSSSAYTYLPGFGIQFNLNANIRGSGAFNFSFAPNSTSDMDLDFEIDIDEDSIHRLNEELERNMDSVQIESRNKMREELKRDMDSMRFISRNTLDSLQVAIEDLAGSVRTAFTVDREPIDPEVLEGDKELLYEEITRAIQEYGNTLSSLPDGEFIIVSVNWSSRETNLPERTYIRLKKNELSSGGAPNIQEVERN